MTYQRDPDQRDPAIDPIVPKVTERQDPRDYIRRNGGAGWPILPLVLAVLFIVMLGFIFTNDRTPSPDRTTSTGVERPAPTTLPKTTPTQPGN